MKNDSYSVGTALFPLGRLPMNVLFKNIDTVSQSVAAVYEAVNEPVMRMARIFEMQVQPILKAFDAHTEILKRQMKIIEMATSRFNFLDSYVKTIKTPVIPTGLLAFPKIVEGEVEGNKENRKKAEKEETVETKLLAAIPVPQTLKPYQAITVMDEYLRLGFGITLSIEGRFRHNRKLIRNLNSSSKHGKFFLMLLTSPNNYLTDEFFKSKVPVTDLEKGIYYIKDDLVGILRDNGLKIHFFRQRKIGYRLLKITKLPN